MFAPGSRYEHVPQAVYIARDGAQIPYVLLRPFPPAAPSGRAHEVTNYERLDLIAYRYYGDPEQFWRICDGTAELRPDDLEVVGRQLAIPLAVR